jgi:hypothetical protein
MESGAEADIGPGLEYHQTINDFFVGCLPPLQEHSTARVIEITGRASEVQVFPTVFTDAIFFETDLLEDKVVDISLYDMGGKMLQLNTTTFSLLKGRQKTRLTLAELKPGIYLLRFKGNGLYKTFKITKR